MDKELTDLWIPVPPFPLPAPLLMVSLPLPLPRPPWMESKRVSKAAKSYGFFPAVADESSFSVLLFFLLSCSCKHRMLFCCWEEFGGDKCQSSSITSAFPGGGAASLFPPRAPEGSISVWAAMCCDSVSLLQAHQVD